MKKSIKTLALAASVLALAGTAQAATVDINVYGASAQYLFWNDAADNFLLSKGCTGVTQASDTGGKHGITTGTCGSDTVNIRYSAKASFESCLSLNGTTNPDSCPSANERKMASSVSAPNTLTCQKVTLGASDVAGESFVQESHGQKFGPRGGNQYDVVLSGVDCSGLTPHNPLIVPFGFFVNKGVTAKQCLPPVATANQYEYCMTDADCGGAAGSCVQDTINNITRLQAVNIFSGYASNWTDFGGYFTDQPITACLRHAGSGTHAALDTAIMNTGLWGTPLPQKENSQFTGALPGYSAFKPKTYFNDGSSDLATCVNTQAGAIGYADADLALSTYANVTGPLKYQGVLPSKTAIIYGAYDFWANQHMYFSTATEADTEKMGAVTAVYDYINNADNLSAAGYGGYWVTEDEINFKKDSDFDFPSHK